MDADRTRDVGAERPWGLWLVMLLCGVVSVCALMMPVVGYVLRPVRETPGAGVWGMLSVALACGTLAWGLVHERRWARHGLMACACLPLAGALPHLGGRGPETMALWILGVGIPLTAFLYLYRAAGVVRYYAHLQHRADG